MKNITYGLALAALATSSAFAAVIVSDGFTDGGVSNGTDTQDTQWYSYNFGNALTVVDDSAASALVMPLKPLTAATAPASLPPSPPSRFQTPATHSR
jgi:hypothetical protein